MENARRGDISECHDSENGTPIVGAILQAVAESRGSVSG